MSREAQMGIMFLGLGTSAGFVLYMKRSDMLFKRVKNIRIMQSSPKKYGPMTKVEWEKVKPRWTKDDDF